MRNGSPATMACATAAVVNRRAKDGGMATARRVGGMDPRPEPASARPPRLALAATAARRVVRPGPAHRGQLAARRRPRPGLPPVLLLPRQSGAKGRRDRRRAVASGRQRDRAWRTLAVRSRRYADQALRAERRRRRRPPQPDAGP